MAGPQWVKTVYNDYILSLTSHNNQVSLNIKARERSAQLSWCPQCSNQILTMRGPLINSWPWLPPKIFCPLALSFCISVISFVFLCLYLFVSFSLSQGCGASSSNESSGAASRGNGGANNTSLIHFWSLVYVTCTHIFGWENKQKATILVSFKFCAPSSSYLSFQLSFWFILWWSSSLCVCMLNRCFRRYSQVF